MKRPNHRTVLLTGVGKPGQLGAALLQAYAERGDTVCAVGRTLAEVEALVAEIRDGGGTAHALAAELGSEIEVDALMTQVRTLTNGHLDVMVHAAGGFRPFGPVAEGTLEAWQQSFADNATSAFLVTRRSLPLLRVARGAIVYVSSVVARGNMSPAGMADYAAAKSALVMLMRAVADEEQGTVRANAIAPGMIRTAEMVRSMGDMPGSLPLSTVVDKILYLAGSESGDITGTLVPM